MFTARLTRLAPRRLLARAASSAASSSVPATPSSSTKPVPAVAQAPNHPTTWSTSQQPRPTPADGPRFEQTIMELQPQPLAAIEMIADEPVRLVHGRKATCDGGIGPLGHPKIFINLDKPGPHACGYCGIRFEQEPHHGHEH